MQRRVVLELTIDNPFASREQLRCRKWFVRSLLQHGPEKLVGGLSEAQLLECSHARLLGLQRIFLGAMSLPHCADKSGNNGGRTQQCNGDAASMPTHEFLRSVTQGIGASMD